MAKKESEKHEKSSKTRVADKTRKKTKKRARG
jgi:hypothetical protein